MTDTPRRSDKEIIKEMRDVLNECALEGKRVLFGACFQWNCRMCGGTSKDSEIRVTHRYFCPVGKLLEETKEAGDD